MQKRQLERKWQNSKLTVDHQIYRNQDIVINKILRKSEQKHTSDKIQECKHDQRKLFKISKQLLGETKEKPMPKSYTKQELPNLFGNFFSEKIRNIRQNLEISNHIDPECTTDTGYTNDTDRKHNTPEKIAIPLQDLEPATTEEIRKIIMLSQNKSSILDPIPTWLLKKHLNLLLPVIKTIVNKSLITPVVPRNLKYAFLHP